MGCCMQGWKGMRRRGKTRDRTLCREVGSEEGRRARGWTGGALKKRNAISQSEPGSMKLEDFIRDILAKEYPQYLPELQKIKSEVVHVLKRLGLVEKQ